MTTTTNRLSHDARAHQRHKTMERLTKALLELELLLEDGHAMEVELRELRTIDHFTGKVQDSIDAIVAARWSLASLAVTADRYAKAEEVTR